MRSEYFFGFTISSIVGVAFETFFKFGYSFGVLLLFLSLIALLLPQIGQSVGKRFTVFLALVGFAFGIFVADISAAHNNVRPLDVFLGQTVSINGIVTEEPDVRESGTNIIVSAQLIDVRGVQNKLIRQVAVLVHAASYPAYQYGDEVRITGKILEPKNFEAVPGERPFDYRAYLAKDDIYYEMSFAKISVVGKEKANWILGKLLQLKQTLMGNIARAIPEPESSLGGGIVLGAKQSLGKEWMQKFRDSGLAHIVVLSGYNIAVIASVIGRAVIFMPFTIRLISSAAGIVLFALMVGGGATVLRATLMALVVILARAMGRESDALRVLVFVGWAMVMINPMILLYDVSFQLSFMAALALVLLSPIIEKYFLVIKNNVLREIFVTTISTQIFVAPILLYHMGTFSAVGLVANLFALPIIPATMFFVSFVAIAGGVPFLGKLVAYPAQFFLSYILSVVQWGSHIPFANIHVVSFGLIPLIIFYSVIFIFCYVMSSNHPKAKVA